VASPKLSSNQSLSSLMIAKHFSLIFLAIAIFLPKIKGKRSSAGDRGDRISLGPMKPASWVHVMNHSMETISAFHVQIVPGLGSLSKEMEITCSLTRKMEVSQ
jgi:hypothetical protein